MATIIVAAIIFGLIAFAAYQVYKRHKNHTLCNGSCDGCWHAERCSPDLRSEVKKTMEVNNHEKKNL